MPIVRWEPFRDLLSLQERMNRLFDDRMARVREESMTGNFTPPVDIYETANAIVLEADLPGLNLEDIDVRVENNTLTIRGERKPGEQLKDENCHRAERSYGVFTRSFTLADQVDTQRIEASYDQGVLRLTMAKREESKPKQIKVQVSGEKQKAVKA